MRQKKRGFKKHKGLSIVLLSIIIFFNNNYMVFSDEDLSHAKVLFISSYNVNLNSIPEQINGLKEVFDSEDIVMDIEYMDAKRLYSHEDTLSFYDYLSYKLKQLEPYDIIVVGDDNALQFALDYGEELFPNTDIIFLGINDFLRANLAVARGNFTGVVEKAPLAENIELGLTFNPEASKVIGIVDNTLTGIGDKKNLFDLLALFPDLTFEVINSSEYTWGDMAYKLNSIEDDAIVLYQSMFEDKNGINLSIEESSKFLHINTKVPIYRSSIGGVGEGVLGGKMISYVESGRIAAEMVVDILRGVSIENIEMIDEIPNQYVFDYILIDEYNIDKDLIPEGAIFVNKEISFYEEYKEYVLSTIIIFTLLSALSISLIIDNIKIRKTEKELLESNEEIAATYEELMAQEEELRAQYNTIEEHLERIKVLNEKNDRMARYDYLTNLPNRNEFVNIIEKEIKRNSSFALLLLDIDHFKNINDSIGHIYGDEILKEVANRFKGIMDEKKFISRFGGDEFLILIIEENEEEIKKHIDEIIQVFDKAFYHGIRENHLTCSVGVTLYPNDGKDINQLLINADTAMYQVKQSGRNHCLFYNDDMKKDLVDRIEIEYILRNAIKADGFKLVYQPVVDVSNGNVSGFEALLRLKNYNISPGYFIEIAEESNLIFEITRWVTKEVIKELAEWKNKRFEQKEVSINVSANQVRDLEYVKFLEDCLVEYQVAPDLLGIEITETILLENTERTMKYLKSLRDVGVKLILDDFGTGYSSINYLSYLSVERVKLDKSLCDRFLEYDNTQVIESIISLVHGLGMEITAEGIEQSEQYYKLRKAGCDYIQGYLFSKPLDVKEIDEIYDINMLTKLNP